MIIRILNNLNEDIETIKKVQSKIKNTITEINNTLEGINRGLDKAKDRISVFERQGSKKHAGRATKRKKIF